MTPEASLYAGLIGSLLFSFWVARQPRSVVQAIPKEVLKDIAEMHDVLIQLQECVATGFQPQAGAESGDLQPLMDTLNGISLGVEDLQRIAHDRPAVAVPPERKPTARRGRPKKGEA